MMSSPNATLPYAIEIANHGFPKIARINDEIAPGVNMVKGKVTYKAVAEAFDLEYVPLEEVIG